MYTSRTFLYFFTGDFSRASTEKNTHQFQALNGLKCSTLWGGGWSSLWKFSYPLVYHAKFGCCTSYSVGACWRSQKFGGARAPLPWDIDRSWNTLLPTRYHTKLGRSVSNSTGVRRGIPKIGGCWAPHFAFRLQWLNPLKYTPPHLCFLTKFGRSRSNGTNVITFIHWINLTPCVPPFKVV